MDRKTNSGRMEGDKPPDRQADILTCKQTGKGIASDTNTQTFYCTVVSTEVTLNKFLNRIHSNAWMDTFHRRGRNGNYV